jgi:orotidine-5'-phosphate decarboxylase
VSGAARNGGGTCRVPAVLASALERGLAPVSVGLEPSPDYLPSGFEPTIEGFERFLKLVIEASADVAAAFKFNLAFFESLGADGAGMLERVRRAIPAHSFVIADAKRGDIGSTAQHYAKACFDVLGAHAATVNPLMGRDAVEPFLAYADRLTYLLCLTSNRGADDFLTRVRTDEGAPLFVEIARAGERWSRELGGVAGFVVGATNTPERLTLLADELAGAPLLVPGIGAQGGSAASINAAFGDPRATGTLFHVTRGVLPGRGEAGDPGEIVRTKLRAFIESTSEAEAT